MINFKIQFACYGSAVVSLTALECTLNSKVRACDEMLTKTDAVFCVSFALHHHPIWLTYSACTSFVETWWLSSILQLWISIYVGGDGNAVTIYCTILQGRLFAGWEDQPMRGNVEIILRGDHRTLEQYLPYGGPTGGAKAIGKYNATLLHCDCNLC